MVARGAHALPEPPTGRAERYSRRAMPAYRYVPGANPHPIRDPSGHAYDPQPKLASHRPWTPQEWEGLDVWLYGVDLFNRFYFWEAHEAWEGLWASAGRETAPFLLLQGLIQIAAALLKTHMRVANGARSLSAEGIDKLRRARVMHPVLMGLDLDAAIVAFETYFEPLRKGELPVIDGGVPVLRLGDKT